MAIKDLLKTTRLFFDGAMGTQLQKRGLCAGDIPEIYNFTHSEIITEIHKKYLQAGADIITTNTFGANELKLEKTGYTVEDVITKAVSVAKDSIKDVKDKYIALDIGPIGQLLTPIGTLSFDRAYEIFKRQVKAGAKAGCDLILIETLSDIYEAKAAVLAAKENSDLPIFCTMTYDDTGRTFTGTDPLTMVMVLEGLGVDALGVNCSFGPKEILPIVEEIVKYTSIPIMVQPNAGLPKVDRDKTVYDIDPCEFAFYAKKIAENGVNIIGGCCGTDELFIKAMIEVVKPVPFVIPDKKHITAVCSANQTVVLGNEVKIIGERINPTGNKKLKEALRNHHMDYVLNEAILQMEAGADVLDVNVGLPEIDEQKTMTHLIKEIQSIIHIPLQIDSTNKEVIEAAARIYNGKPIINSVNGKEQVMKEIFPIVKKYGACVIGLTLDEEGIPKKAEERVKIAQKIIRTAQDYGIPKENIMIDCLVLTASAQQSEVMETIKAVGMVKEKYNVKTSLGVSNVSFGLPDRQLLNQTFLAMGLTQGLDAPILNPLDQGMINTIHAFKVLSNQDKEAKKYIQEYESRKSEKRIIEKAHVHDKDLKDIIIQGLKDEATKEVTKLLETIEPLKIVDEYLIPALDMVGKKFEKGDIFLPQLIQSAETVKNAFGVIKDKMLQDGNCKISKGKIILATVKGDIHDIGKNIVKTILENYGFEVLDLGKDVPVENIVKTAKEQKIKLVGLSALMTTTVKSMEETIIALRENRIDCKIFVGGAVLNQEYADMIQADYYAKDAQVAVEIAKTVLGSSSIDK
ncbi:homocysteine S-methyltransferase family protein [Inediibacterium massiliense]|uniref:homocysteine S-methyltransferase family protein n=1 Tax=Inediibacterium massiliense TaxID=1658111 RepID=UPI0006B52821|nr:homocysteine S-methyltransferase family protein [Inediibacterium massiliense]